jgi:hypothetical protein
MKILQENDNMKIILDFAEMNQALYDYVVAQGLKGTPTSCSITVGRGSNNGTSATLEVTPYKENIAYPEESTIEESLEETTIDPTSYDEEEPEEVQETEEKDPFTI